MSLHILAKVTLFCEKWPRKFTFNFWCKKDVRVYHCASSHLEQEQYKYISGAGKATKYLSAESGDFSESEVEIVRKSKIQFQEKPSTT